METTLDNAGRAIEKVGGVALEFKALLDLFTGRLGLAAVEGLFGLFLSSNADQRPRF